MMCLWTTLFCLSNDDDRIAPKRGHIQPDRLSPTSSRVVEQIWTLWDYEKLGTSRCWPITHGTEPVIRIVHVRRGRAAWLANVKKRFPTCETASSPVSTPTRSHCHRLASCFDFTQSSMGYLYSKPASLMIIQPSAAGLQLDVINILISKVDCPL